MTGANPFAKVWSGQDYRRLSVLMLVAGVAVSSAIPLVALFLTDALGVDESAAGLFFLTSLGAPLINLYTGALSDRLESRVSLVRGIAVWLALGWALMRQEACWAAAGCGSSDYPACSSCPTWCSQRRASCLYGTTGRGVKRLPEGT
jgi:MFS family permease